jgi:hypothetical protein
MNLRRTTCLLLLTLAGLPCSAPACGWDGGTVKLVPGIVEVQRGCCDNDGNLRLVVCSHVVLSGRRRVGVTLVGGMAIVVCASTWGVVRHVSRRKQSRNSVNQP